MLRDNGGSLASCSPLGSMLYAEGAAAASILADIENPDINRQVLEKITSLGISPYYRQGSTAIKLVAQPLSTKYMTHLQGFQSSHECMVNYLKNCHEAFEYEATGQAKTTLFLDATDRLIAYAAIKCSSLRVEESPQSSFVFPAIELVMLCVDDRYRRRGAGEAVLSYIMRVICGVRSSVGVRLITLFSLKDAVEFYTKKFGFKELSAGMHILVTPTDANCVPMYLVLPRDRVV